METNILPIQLNETNENPYGGFWLRVKAGIIDFMLFVPLLAFIHYLNSLGVETSCLASIIILIFGLVYSIYLPKKYGGTPGKLLVGLKIVKTNGESIAWKESILRFAINIPPYLFGTFITLKSLQQVDPQIYLQQTWVQKGIYLQKQNKSLYSINLFLNNFLIAIEFVTLLTNKRKRAIHDYIAKTLVVKTKFISSLQNQMNQNKSNTHSF